MALLSAGVELNQAAADAPDPANLISVDGEATNTSAVRRDKGDELHLLGGWLQLL